MYPLSSIPQTLPATTFVSRPDVASPGLDSVTAPDKLAEVNPGQSADGSFGKLLGRMVEEVNSSQNAATEAMNALQSGGNVSLHQAVIAMEEASVSFQLMVEVRNKLLDSYQEIMRMQV